MIKKVFVQIASYRDAQLVPTVLDLLENADNPDLFNFGICWQHDEKEDISEIKYLENVKILDYHFSESKGLGWARKEIASLYSGESYTLQLDSHHRFKKGWDTLLLEDYKEALEYSKKPIISTYLTPFSVSENECKCSLNPTPCLMSQYEFSEDKLLMSMPWYIRDYESRNKLIRARTLSGHFLFTEGNFIEKVPYDPEIYFGGYCEETTMSVRAWTTGYDFFSPYRQYVWHEYTREGRPKHWDDHSKNSKTEITSNERDIFSRKKTRQIFKQDDYDIELREYGLGKQRTLQEYERFCGFDFKNCKIQKYTLDVNEPPNPLWDKKKEKNIKKIKIDWDINFFKKQQQDPFKVITFGIVDKNQNNLFRQDFTEQNGKDYLSYQKNSLEVEVDLNEAKKIVMYGLTKDDKWSLPFEKELK